MQQRARVVDAYWVGGVKNYMDGYFHAISEGTCLVIRLNSVIALVVASNLMFLKGIECNRSEAAKNIQL